MNKIVNVSMLALMVVSSIVTMITYAPAGFGSRGGKIDATAAMADLGQLPARVEQSKQPEVIEHFGYVPHQDTDDVSVLYSQKKAIVIDSYQLSDPRAKPASL